MDECDLWAASRSILDTGTDTHIIKPLSDLDPLTYAILNIDGQPRGFYKYNIRLSRVKYRR